MSFAILVPPVLDPVTLAETKTFLQLDSSHDDTLIGELIQAATESVEKATGRALISRTLRQSVYAWPHQGVFILQARPLVQVLQVQHVDAGGTVSIVDPVSYYVDPNRARIIALSSFARFSFTHPSEVLQIDFIAGYGASESSVPASLRTALLLMVRDLYEHRGETGGALPLRAQALLAPFMEARL